MCSVDEHRQLSPVSVQKAMYWSSPGLNNGQALTTIGKVSCNAKSHSELKGLSSHHGEKLFKAAGGTWQHTLKCSNKTDCVSADTFKDGWQKCILEEGTVETY